MPSCSKDGRLKAFPGSPRAPARCQERHAGRHAQHTQHAPARPHRLAQPAEHRAAHGVGVLLQRVLPGKQDAPPDLRGGSRETDRRKRVDAATEPANSSTLLCLNKNHREGAAADRHGHGQLCPGGEQKGGCRDCCFPAPCQSKAGPQQEEPRAGTLVPTAPSQGAPAAESQFKMQMRRREIAGPTQWAQTQESFFQGTHCHISIAPVTKQRAGEEQGQERIGGPHSPARPAGHSPAPRRPPPRTSSSHAPTPRSPSGCSSGGRAGAHAVRVRLRERRARAEERGPGSGAV